MEIRQANTTAIDRLCCDIGLEGTIRVLEFALPRILGYKTRLRELLSQGHYEEAACCAHKAVSAVRAYGTPRLEVLLREVIAIQGEPDVEALCHDLSDEFTRVIGQIEAWLQLHTLKFNFA